MAKTVSPIFIAMLQAKINQSQAEDGLLFKNGIGMSNINFTYGKLSTGFHKVI
jgi:hypothetical protein